ncbi:3D-(3,5/4)-trihydroxycyclohexane-1,2-dione acylhydrolase (decyclizing) [Streptomyces xanthochromogenes]
MTGTTRRLTTAQALVAFLARQYTACDGVNHRLIAATWGIFGHGNVAGIGQALLESGPEVMPFHQGRNEQAMVHAAVGHARQSGRLSTHAVTTSIGPGATNLVTGAALATVNHLPVLLLPGDTFAGRPADPVLQQLEVPYAGDVSVNDCLRPVSRYFDRISRPEALIPAALNAMGVLTDPANTGAVTLALPQDVQAEAYDWPEEFFRERVWQVRAPAVEPEELAVAVRELRSARRPLIVAGGGVRHARAQDVLGAFAEDTGIPVASTQAGKGALPHDHPQDVGGVGHTGTAAADALARTADVVLGVGTRWTDFTTASATLFQNPDVRFLNLNVRPADAHKMGGHQLVGDARTGLAALRDALKGHRVPADHEAECARLKAAWEVRVSAAYAPASEDARPTQAQVLGVLDTLVTGDDILINAAGSLPGDLSLLDHVPTSADAYRDEIFGPVLCVLRAETYEEGLALINASPFGNGTAIFTRDGGAARRFQLEVEAGMVGVNVPIPVPVGYHSFGGWKDSLFGDHHIYGNDGTHFYTRGKVVTTRWPDPADGPSGVDLGFPRNH